MIIISWGPKTKQPKKKKSEEEKTHFRKSILMDDFHLCSFLSQKLLLFFPLCDLTINSNKPCHPKYKKVEFDLLIFCLVAD